ncbi:DUF3658 domain-containing protein [Chryseobacterium sp. SIMBA_038]|uniref:DUF3658 domain-containing protein n=1 Tax=Chryseobacterium sp. SIMBA_038 TaxID=3085780 RepID=UPI00397AF585
MIDFKKAIHLVYSNPGRGNLESYFKTHFPEDKIQIHCIYNDLTTGPLNDFTSAPDFEKFSSYWKTIDAVCSPETIENNEENSINFNDLSKEFSIDFPKETPLIIWHGSDAGEKLMLYRYCNLLKNRDLYEINLDDWPTTLKNDYRTNCLAIQNPEDLDGVFNILNEIDENTKSFYANEWERLKKDQKTNRILQDDRVISVNEDYYDQSILDNCTSDYQKAARVIGETMGKQKSTIGDYYLLYRTHMLIDQQLLEYQGDLSIMRDLEIRKNKLHPVE